MNTAAARSWKSESKMSERKLAGRDGERALNVEENAGGSVAAKEASRIGRGLNIYTGVLF